MTTLSTAAALDLWECAQSPDPVARAVALAAAAAPPAEAAAVAAWPLGRRDARLLSLLGDAVEATAACPACGEHVEFALDVPALLALEDAEPVPLEVGGRVLEWRCPTSEALRAAALAGSPEAAERVLLECCAGGPLPAPARAAVAAAMAAADPLAEVLVELRCPACAAAFTAELDIAELVWAELSAHAQRALHAVDTLARAYGWTEPEVLALSERRRASYLELAVGEVS